MARDLLLYYNNYDSLDISFDLEGILPQLTPAAIIKTGLQLTARPLDHVCASSFSKFDDDGLHDMCSEKYATIL